MLYYPECTGQWFFVDIPSKEFSSDEEAIEFYRRKYGKFLMAVVRDNDPEITMVYERAA